MPKLNANLSMMYNEVDFLERFGRAAASGFSGVEFLFPYDYPAEQLAEKLRDHGLIQVLFNLPAGDWAAGERGLASLPGREGEFQEGVGRAIEYAKVLGCGQVNCLAGIPPQGADEDKVRATFVDNLRFAAAAMAKENVRLLAEAINTRDIPGFYLNGSAQALSIMDEVNHPNLWFQYDIYHMQIMEGDLTPTIREHLGRISHMQLADTPGRHEPGTGEINFPNLLRFIDEAGYTGWIGCEYVPAGNTEDGLTWAQAYL